MAKKIRKLPFALRLAYAWDAAPEAAKANLNGNSLVMAINAVEAQREGVDPRKIGLDIDKDSTVEEIVARFCPECDEATLSGVVELLEKLKGAPETIAVEERVKENEEPEEVEVEKKIPEDEEDPEEQKAFAEGVKYGEEVEKKEPEHLDRLHESIGEKKALGEVTDADGETYSKEEVNAKIAALRKEMEAKIEAAKVKATDEAKEHYEGLSKAAQDCAPLVKIADPMAYKSSADIYRKALKLRGVAADSMPDSALPAMVNFVKRNAGASVSSRPIVAADAAPAMDADFDVIKALEKRIKVY